VSPTEAAVKVPETETYLVVWPVEARLIFPPLATYKDCDSALLIKVKRQINIKKVRLMKLVVRDGVPFFKGMTRLSK